MEQEQHLSETPGEEQQVNGCVNCGRKDIVEGYPTPLCPDCRNLFIKFPIPIWVKIFAGVVAALMILALVTFPKNLSLGLHLERGKIAEKEHRYVTAGKEFKAITDKFPYNKEALEHQFIAAYYNMDLPSVYALSQKLEHMTFDEDELWRRMNNCGERMIEFYPNDSLMPVIQPWLDKDAKAPDSALRAYLIKHPNEVYAMYMYAGFQMDENQFEATDSVVEKILEIDNEYLPALRLLASSKREQGKFQESIDACYRIIRVNKEAAFGYASMARTYLKQKKDKEGLDLALKAHNINDKETFSLATLAMAYHFNNQPAKRDEILKNSKELNDSSAKDQLQYALDVISGKEKFRN